MILIAVSLSALIALGSTAPAHAAPIPPAPENSTPNHSTSVADREVLAELRNNIEAAAISGDATAQSSLATLDNLGEEKRAELSRILLDEGIIQASQRQGSGVSVVKTGSCTTPPAAITGQPSVRATYNVTANCDSDFTFAGISVTKVRMTGNYVTGNGVVLSTSNVSAYVVHSYEPGASVSFSNFSHYRSGGQGYFQTTVTVTRSLFGWNHSTRSGNLRLVTNGPGVVSCGWV